MSTKGSMLVLTDDVIVSASTISNVVRELQIEGCNGAGPLIITQATSLSQLPLESSTLDVVISISRTIEFPNDHLYKEILKVLKPGGLLVVHHTSSMGPQTGKATSSIERKLLVAGFIEAQSVQLGPALTAQSFGIRAKKPAWTIGSSFSIKRATKSLPKVQIDDDLDLIDEDSLLTEEDLKRPQLPPIGDCEVGSTRKACKNCACGRAEAEERVQKLGLTVDQLNNPQSACGSCGLGDAFRCSTCPYKGLPPFKLGEKVSLPGNFLAADI
ncbi:Methyltransferase type 11 [Dillenia turbinata]|uniref:Anamorsin homolog n=1 Tax=Dillenia turbinata TaxID=194707 RepID=A0AAN8YV67_9MAGN